MMRVIYAIIAVIYASFDCKLLSNFCHFSITAMYVGRKKNLICDDPDPTMIYHTTNPIFKLPPKAMVPALTTIISKLPLPIALTFTKGKPCPCCLATDPSSRPHSFHRKNNRCC
jgi:hypothetical protein